MSNYRIMVAETTMRNDRLNEYVILLGGHYRYKEYIIARMQKIMPILICNLNFDDTFSRPKVLFKRNVASDGEIWSNLMKLHCCKDATERTKHFEAHK